MRYQDKLKMNIYKENINSIILKKFVKSVDIIKY